MIARVCYQFHRDPWTGLSACGQFQIFIQRSAGNPQDVLTEEIKDLKAEIHRKDQWIQKMHGVSVSLSCRESAVERFIMSNSRKNGATCFKPKNRKRNRRTQ